MREKAKDLLCGAFASLGAKTWLRQWHQHVERETGGCTKACALQLLAHAVGTNKQLGDVGLLGVAAPGHGAMATVAVLLETNK